MPRRPSASVGASSLASTPNASTILVHRTTESHHMFSSLGSSSVNHHSLHTLGSSSTTPQQKIVQVLVNRLKHKLPCNSGLSLDRVEADQPTQQAVEALVELSKDSLDMIAWALCELLDRLAKQIDAHTGHLTIEVLQSQLFVLKVLSVTMASRWNQNASSDDHPLSSPDSPVPPESTPNKNRRPAPSEYSTAYSVSPTLTPLWQEPPALDDSCVKYILSVMVLFMRQTAISHDSVPPMLQVRSTDMSFRDFDDNVDLNNMENQQPPSSSPNGAPLRNGGSSNFVRSSGMSVNSAAHIAATNTQYEKTHMSLVKSALSVNNLIAKYVRRIIFHISASNWNVVFDRLSTKLNSLAANPDSTPDVVDLQLIAHSLMDRQRLVMLLNQLSSLLVEMKNEAQYAIVIHLRSAVWNWIDIFPAEFNDVILTRGKTEGAPERVFDLLYSLVPAGGEKHYWTTLTILHCITSERISSEFQFGTATPKSRRDIKFYDNVINNMSHNAKFSETALVCAVDICRAATYIDSAGDIPLRSLSLDIAHDIKNALYNSSGSRKPFWDSYDDIDVALYAEALVAIFRFLPPEESEPLFKTCLEPERSDAVKTAVTRACLTLVQDAPRFPWQKSLDSLQLLLSGNFRDVLRYSASQRQNEVEYNGMIKRIASRPRPKSYFPEPLSDREVLILSILSLWRESLGFFMKVISKENINSWVTIVANLWTAPIDTSVKVSAASCIAKISERSMLPTEMDNDKYRMMDAVKAALPMSLITVSSNLMLSRNNLDAERLWISAAYSIMELYTVKSELESVKALQSDPNRVPGFALAEISFLIALTSANNDISHTAAKGLCLIAHAERQPNAPVNTAITEEDRSNRNPIYEQLGDPRITIAGRLGHQKRIRKLVRMLRFSAGIHLAVWEECYWRWRKLNESINNALNEANILDDDAARNLASLEQQDTRFQWHNLTLFLAALAGSCVGQELDTQSLMNVIPLAYMPDSIRVQHNLLPQVEEFIGDLMALLVTTDIQIRDIVREALGSELSPRLYSRLIRNIDQTLSALLKSPSTTNNEETHSVFLEQIIAILKLLTDNTGITLEDVMNVDISSSMHHLATFIGRASQSSAHRIKIKFCVLCETVCDRLDTLTLRRDDIVRHDILNYVFQWIIPGKDAASPGIFNELNMACLRAAVKLLDRFHLRALAASNAGDEITHFISRLFNRYSTALLACLDCYQPDVTAADSASDVGSTHQKSRTFQKEAEVRELVITGLTHLVSANSESGFKQCLPLAYDQDNRKRTIFAHVFARVIGQGTVFDPQEKVQTKPRQTALCDLVRSPNMVLAMTICEACPPGEVEMMISVLLNIFDTRSSLMDLIKLMIEREVAQTQTETALFRSNSTCTRFLSAFARLHGYQYLRSLVQPLLDTMVQIPPGSGFEIDPTKAKGQDISKNQQNVEYVAETFLKLVSSSLPALPGMFREICAHIGKVVTEIWPDAKYAAMGAFIFLRFISPAIVFPETIDIELPKGENTAILRRGLMVIAKIIQNLANNIFFGKEAHMTTLNSFLESNITNVTRFLSELHKYTPTPDGVNDVWEGTTSDDTDAVVLHRFFQKHADKIGKELLSLSRPSAEGDSSSVNGKRAWDALCALLVDLGSPMDVPSLSPYNSSEHQEYLELMEKYENRSTATVEHLFVETEVKDEIAVFILRLAKIEVENLDIELLMYHILKTLSLPAYISRSYDIILDCTGFTSVSEVPLQWLKYCAELIPMDIRNRFSSTRILSPNLLTQKYLRRLYNISAGTPLCSEIKTYTSVMQLMEDVRTPAFASLAYPVSLEQEPHESFSDILMKTPTKVPVVFRVGTTHIRVTSVRAMPISPKISCKSTELIPLADVSDIYNVSTGSEPNEFIIRRRQGVTIYFLSPHREHIVRSIRTAKGKLKETPIPLSDRFTVFSNVAATLLHIGFFSVDLDDEELRGAAYDLLGAVCKYLKYDKSPIIASKAGFIAGDPVAFTTSLSERLAEFAPQLTLDFIHEVSSAMTSMSNPLDPRKISCLLYMSPWIKNLSFFANPTHTLYERSGARLRDCVRTLTEISLAYPEVVPGSSTLPVHPQGKRHLTSTTQRLIWSEIAKLDYLVVDIILDELVRTATDGGLGSWRTDSTALIIAALSSIHVRGRIYSKLRKALSKIPLKVTNSLLEHQNWNEIATLIRLCLVVGSQSSESGTSYLYVPEILHLVSLTAGEGQSVVRKSVYGMVVNLLQSLYIARQDDSTEPGLMQLINDCTLPETLILFGLKRETPTSEYANLDCPNERTLLDMNEKLVQFLIRIMDVSAGSPGLLNVWKARWMSLVTSTAFQQSPAVQTRSFIVLAALATADVDDDFLYQILVAFKTALIKANENNTMTIVSMLRCMWKIIPAIPESRYVSLLFWLGVALLQASHLGFYVEATCLLRVTLENMEIQGLFRGSSVQAVLLSCREPIEEFATQLDEILKISFETSFSFSLSAIIFKGMRHSGLRESAEMALRTLIRVSMSAYLENQDNVSNGSKHILNPEVLGYFLALIPVSSTASSYARLLKGCYIDDETDLEEVDGLGRQVPRLDPNTLGINDPETALLVTSFVATILTSAQGDDTETQMLYDLLSSIAVLYPEIISITYETMQERIKDIFANSSNPSIVRSVSNIFRVAMQDPIRSGGSSAHHGSTSTLSTTEDNQFSPGRNHLLALDELGMQGLANAFTFLPVNKGYSTVTKVINWIPQLVHLMLFG